MNKDNAHLYLPLVQALAEGKEIQSDALGEWMAWPNPDWSLPPERYRIKPLDFAPIPEGAERHNPDNLTPEQVGEGYRLCCSEEPCDIPNEFYNKTKGEWITGGQFGNEVFRAQSFTYRTPLSTPYPDGSYVKDVKLVKPWKPRFKVGDRVKGASTGAVLGKVIAIRDGTQCYEVIMDGDHRGSFGEEQLEPAPWTLTRHIPGFRPLRDGEEWHRTDWTEEMLPDGWRPLLKGEIRLDGDEAYCFSGKSWAATIQAGVAANDFSTHLRTRRPLPSPEPAKVPLVPEDVPPGSALRAGPDDNGWAVITSCGDGGIDLAGINGAKAYSFQRLMDGGYQIHRPGNLDANGKPVFQPCWKLQ